MKREDPEEIAQMLEAQLSYWRRQLEGAPGVLELPADHPRPPVQGFQGASRSLRLSRELSEALRALGRVDFARVRVHEGQVEPLAVSGASILSSTTRADGFVLVPADLEGYAPGEEVEVFLYDNP